LLKLQRKEHELDFLSRIFETTNEGIIITDANKAILKVNSGFCRATGYEENEVIGKNPGILKSGRQDKDFYTVMWDTIDNTGQWEGELWNKGKNGSLYAEWLNISAIHDANGKLTNYVGIFSDISAVESKHEHISHLAYHDHLTGLPNRLLLEERLSQAILNAGRAATKLGIMYIDIDNFKPVNDQFGHHAGDQLLREISERLKACVRQSDTLARIGGDEFMILLSHLVDSESSRLVAEKILKSLSMPFIIENTEINVGCSLGISLYPDNGNDMNALIQRADQAMYVSKQNNSPGYMFYSA
ncbi:MAG: diguanylate cyclase, partial [Gammaproteobacteria bacterium]|nr:diguanylate cyclase [Gammaproteobacteria bacterium]